MSAYINYLNSLTNKNRSQYPEYSDQIKWIGYYEAEEKEEERNQIIQKLGKKLNWSFKNTKPWVNSLSKGCQLCGQGEWSCLFITGKCNAKCFYCPTAQDQDGIPSTQLTSFDNPEDYVAYLKYFGFKGASLSGGEPLLVFERTLNYIRTIRKEPGDEIYLWMYTNGLLGSKEVYQKLADAGIDEVRFDIGATGYNLKYIALASGIIPNLTVEIPAVPEDFEKIKQVIPELIKLGITNLNLHQLRLTNYNAPKLLKRNYTYLHGEQATVLESELTALKIIEFAVDHNLKIGINYCAFNFKNKFQKAGFRRKIASKFIDTSSQLTENGYLRSLSNNGSSYVIENNQLQPSDQGKDNCTPEHLKISYKGLLLDDHLENQHYLKKIIIGNKAFFLRTGLTQNTSILENHRFPEFIHLLKNQGKQIPDDQELFALWKNEFIEWDLRGYF